MCATAFELQRRERLVECDGHRREHEQNPQPDGAAPACTGDGGEEGLLTAPYLILIVDF